MTGRLAVIGSLVKPAATIADVGCDHGKIAEYCIHSGLCERVIASDISEKCLNKARKRIGEAGNVSYKVCDGIDYECDEAVIAGMGGMLIVDIIKNAAARALLPRTLIICAHRDTDAVRRTLNALGYRIDADLLAEERGKLYFVLRAVPGEQTLGELQYLYGVHYAEDCELLKTYLKRSYNVLMLAPEQNSVKLEALTTAMRAQGMTVES